MRAPDAARSPFIGPGVRADTADWREVLSASLGKAMSNQLACSEAVVRGRGWNVDFGEGTIYFGDDGFPVQFIGSESSSSGTWLWGWENVNGFPDGILRVAASARAAGEGWGLPPLTTPELALGDAINGHTLSVVAVSVCGEDVCYYRGPHDGGAVLMAFPAPEEVFAPVDAMRFVSVSMQCIQQFDVDHEVFIRGFLHQNGTPYSQEGDAIIAGFDRDLRIEFESAGGRTRVRRMTTA
ncbi:MAG: hypothetical protein FWH47_00530 [Methanomassiliicoccaceae archaeon]|nr:hypothetical protein [Methanomassiliicoccaceae archaeon]